MKIDNYYSLILAIVLRPCIIIIITILGVNIMDKKQTILNELFEHQNQYFSGDQLAQKLHMSRTMIWKYIKALQEDGFEIESKKSAGYRLVKGYTLNATLIKNRLNDTVDVQTFKTIDSTNTYLKNYLSQNVLNRPLAIIAEQQTAGYGKYKREFYSPDHGGLYLSLSLPLGDQNIDPSLLTTSVAVGVMQMLQKYFPKQSFSVKWVNDIYKGNKKIVGILTEATTDLESFSPSDVVIGIGINLTTEKFPAELKDKVAAAGEILPADINEIAADLIQRLIKIYSDYKTGKYLDFYRMHLNLLDNVVTLQVGNKKIKGKVLGINDQGGLIIEDNKTGDVKAYYSGEVQKVLHE